MKTTKKCIMIVGAAVFLLAGANEIQAQKPVFNDFNRNGSSDLAVYHPAGGHWFIRTRTGAVLEWYRQWGYASAVPVPGDYNGDGQTDLAVYDRNGGLWYILTRSGRVLAWGVQWGWSTAVPVPGDYNGDGKTDLGVYDLETGNWYVASLNRGGIHWSGIIHWNDNWGFKGPRHALGPQASTVIPMPYDYDRDGITDRAVYYRGTGMTDSGTYILGSAGRNWFPAVWGSSGSIPAPGLYRSVVTQTYPAGISTYKVKESPGANDGGTVNTPYMHAFKQGIYGQTLPVAAHDFDGNGWDDHAVYNFSNGRWTIYFNDGMGNGAPPDGQVYQQPPTSVIQWGFSGAIPANIYNTIYTACGYGVRPW